jgi:endoribonuclease Dicer
VKHLRNLYLEDGNLNYENLSPNKRNKGEEIIHLANRSLHFSSVKNSVVLSLHTGRIYSVLDLILDTTADDSFDEVGVCFYALVSRMIHSVMLPH